jgi:hypothetical protein
MTVANKTDTTFKVVIKKLMTGPDAFQRYF